MKIEHHQLLGVNTLMVMERIMQNRLALPGNIDLEPVMANFRPNLKAHRVNRKIFREYLAAPDRIRDLYIKMPFGIDDRYAFLGHGLSSFQHFTVVENGAFRGYDWDRDDSLSGLEELGDAAMTIFSTHVEYDTTVEEFGFNEAILAGSPINKLISGPQANVDLDDFEFPTGARVGGYYGDEVARNPDYPLKIKIRAAGFTLHFVMDACCAHHTRGFLLNGHREWEQRLHKFWASRFETPQDQASLINKFDAIAVEVVGCLQNDAGLAACATVGDVIKSNATFTRDWLGQGDNGGNAGRGEINRRETKNLCVRAIASSIVAMAIMFKP